MAGGSKGVYPAVFAGVFLFIFIIGISSEVSISASVSRALLAALVFTALVWIISRVVGAYVLQERPASEGLSRPADLGSRLDITVGEQTANIPQQEQTPVPSTENPAGQAEAEAEAEAGFTPLVARQIDPQVTKIINSDPDKMADIVRKMGFEEE